MSIEEGRSERKEEQKRKENKIRELEGTKKKGL